MEKHYAIIPCRRGSKSIKNKNLIKLRDKTLVAHAVEQAVRANIFDGIVITTDYFQHELQIEEAKHGKKIIYIKRPASLCMDNSLMVDVIEHALTFLGGKMVNWLWLLQPTSPFRTKEDFKAIKRAVDSGEYSSALSFKPSKDHPNRSYSWKNDQCYRLRHVNYDNKQDLKPMLTRSGNFYVVRKEKFLEKGKVEVGPFYSHIMGGVNPDKMNQKEYITSLKMGLNIDDELDHEIAKGMMRRGEYYGV